MTSSHSMTILVKIVVLLSIYTTVVECIKCYECVHNSQRTKRQRRYLYPCSEFDHSEKFIRDCPDSDMCVYQHISLKFDTGIIDVHTMDGCTPNRTQLTRYSEAGVLKAGCIQHISRYKPPSSMFCYCDFNLCNGVVNNSLGTTLRATPMGILVGMVTLIIWAHKKIFL